LGWVEDLYGLTEIDGKTGQVLRAVKLPRRVGEVDLRDDSGRGLHVVDVASGKVRYSLTATRRRSN